MKTRVTYLIAIFILAFNFGFTQDTPDEKLSLMNQYVKAKNFDEAEKYFRDLRANNPQHSLAIYSDGEKILKERIKNSSGNEKAEHVSDLAKLWEERLTRFASKTPKGRYIAKSAKLMYDNNDVLNKSDQELYNYFDNAYKTDLKTFTSPVELFTYFKLAVKLFDAKQLPAEALFTKYDEVSEKVEAEIKNYTLKLNKYQPQLEAGEQLSRRDQNRVNSYSSYLKGYDQITKGMNSEVGIRANCDNLIPLYERNYEENKNDGLWLQRAMNRLFGKECTDSDLFVKIVEQKNNIEPNANTAYYLGILKDKAGDENGAITFYNQAIDLETDSYEKAKILERIANKFKKSRKYGKAREYYRRALKENPSLGRAHLQIASMYASSANNCGDTTFDKKATFWYAIQEARKASRIDPSLKSRVSKTIANWEGLAPTKTMIFSEGKEGETIQFKCWVGGSVKVPSLKTP